MTAVAVCILVVFTAIPEAQPPGAENLPNLATMYGVVLVMLYIANLLLTPTKRRFISMLPVIFFLTFSVVVVVSFVNSINIEEGITQFIKLLLLFFIYVVMLPGILTSSHQIDFVLVTMIFIGVVASLYGFYEWRVTGSTYITSHPWMGLDSSATGISSYLVIATPISFCWMLYSNTLKIRFISTLVFFLLIFALIGTATRSSMLAFSIAIIPVLWLKFGRLITARRITIFLILFLLVGLASYLLYTQVVVKTRESIIVSSGKTTIESSNFERQLLWQIGFDLFQKHPILGGGFGTFRDYSRNYSTLAYDYDAHGLSLKLLSETGLLGFVLFNMFLLIILIHTWKAIVLVPNRFYAIAVFSALCSSIVHNQFGTRYFFPLFWLVVGLAIATRLVAINESAGIHD